MTTKKTEHGHKHDHKPQQGPKKPEAPAEREPAKPDPFETPKDSHPQNPPS